MAKNEVPDSFILELNSSTEKTNLFKKLVYAVVHFPPYINCCVFNGFSVVKDFLEHFSGR